MEVLRKRRGMAGRTDRTGLEPEPGPSSINAPPPWGIANRGETESRTTLRHLPIYQQRSPGEITSFIINW